MALNRRKLRAWCIEMQRLHPRCMIVTMTRLDGEVMDAKCLTTDGRHINYEECDEERRLR